MTTLEVVAIAIALAGACLLIVREGDRARARANEKLDWLGIELDSGLVCSRCGERRKPWVEHRRLGEDAEERRLRCPGCAALLLTVLFGEGPEFEARAAELAADNEIHTLDALDFHQERRSDV